MLHTEAIFASALGEALVSAGFHPCQLLVLHPCIQAMIRQKFQLAQVAVYNGFSKSSGKISSLKQARFRSCRQITSRWKLFCRICLCLWQRWVVHEPFGPRWKIPTAFRYWPQLPQALISWKQYSTHADLPPSRDCIWNPSCQISISQRTNCWEKIFANCQFSSKYWSF